MTTSMASAVDLHLLKEVDMTHFHTLALNTYFAVWPKIYKAK